MATAKVIADYEHVFSDLQAMNGYRDSGKKIAACEARITEIRAEERRQEEQRAEEARKAAEAAARKKRAVTVFVVLLLILAGAGYWAYGNVWVPMQNYNAAAALMKAGKYEEAITAFSAMNGYKDSTAQITVCETAIKDEKYNAAAGLMKAGKYEEAITAFSAMNGYKDSIAQITACETAIKDEKYEAAAALMKSGKYAEAYAAYVQLKGYKDVDTLLATDENLKAAAAAAREAFIAQLYVGNTVTMGYYGGEAVEWLVLAAEGDTRTMIAVKGQDAVCFNKSRSDGNKWETSYIRTWLNETYNQEAFSAEEQAMLIAGPTGDKVWLLSVEEAKQYFANDEARVCYPSAYAKQNGAWTNSSGAGWWWLRSPGSYSDYAADVVSSGVVYSDGYYVYGSSGMARPVVAVSVAAGVSSGFTKS